MLYESIARKEMNPSFDSNRNAHMEAYIERARCGQTVVILFVSRALILMHIDFAGRGFGDEFGIWNRKSDSILEKARVW